MIEVITPEIIKNKKIICFGNTPLLKEFITEFHAIDQILTIFETNPSKCGIFTFEDSNIPVIQINSKNIKQSGSEILLITDSYYSEYYKLIYENNPTLKVYYFQNLEDKLAQKFLELYNNKPLENIIVFRSGPHTQEYVPGMDFTDNSKALFEYMLRKKYNLTYKLVWIVKNPNQFNNYLNYKNVIFISMDWSTSQNEELTNLYFYYLLNAKYIFFTDAYGFAKYHREGQIRVQLWHGCGFKKRLNNVPCKERYEYMPVTSSLYAHMHANEFGLDESQMIISGIPKIDWLFSGLEENKLSSLKLPKTNKYVFWLPTYRTAKETLQQNNSYTLNNSTGLPLIETEAELLQLNNKLAENNITLIIKLHPYQDTSIINDIKLSNIISLQSSLLFDLDIQINQLLHYADALISDYSSVAIDFLALQRPIGFINSDINKYAKSRGFIFKNIYDFLPGKIINNYTSLEEFILDSVKRPQKLIDEYKDIANKLQEFHDGRNSERLIKFLGI